MSRQGSNKNRSRRRSEPDRSRSRPQISKRKPERQTSRSKPKKAETAEKPQGRGNILKNELSTGVIVSDAKALLHACETHPQLKVTDTQIYFNKNLLLRDVAIRGKGPLEDTIYAGNKGIHLNIRRGNSYLVSKDTHNVVCARRGLRKFYDLQPEYLEHNLGTLPTLDGQIGPRSAAENKSIHRKIFGEIKEFYDTNSGSVIIFEANKANGENCQISWVVEAGAWVVASKNVAMLLRTVEDLALYVGERFHYAEIIAREWFITIKKLKEPQVEAIKEVLRDFTLIGEYVGNPNYQHLVKYDRQGFLFYSLVHKHASEEALLPKEALEKIKGFGLQAVHHRAHAPCKTYAELNTKLKELYSEVKEATIESKEEGVVLYLVKQYNSGKEELVSLCKLKTLEYQIYRKIREKLRVSFEKKISRTDLEAKFTEEVKKLAGTSKLPHDLEFYVTIFKLAFDFAEKGEEVSHLILGQFVTFISILIYCAINSVPVSMGFFEKSVVSDILATPYSKYTDLKKKLKVNDAYQPKAPRTIIFIPLTIPGMGKSYLYKEVLKPYCEENGLSIRYVSSDQVRRAEMNALHLKQPSLLENALFAQTRETADEMFNRLLIHYLKERYSEDRVIYIDKNHPPNAIKKTVELIHAHKPSHSDVRLLAIMPKSKPGPNIKIGEKEVSYPFSLETCLSCLTNVQTRKNHETLNGNGIDSASVVIMFYNMFRDFKFDGSVLKDLGFNGGTSVDFFGETFNFSKEALDKITEIISKLNKAGDKPKDITLLDQLMGLLQENFFNQHQNRPTKDVQVKSIANVLKNLPVERPPQLSITTKIHPHPAQQSSAKETKQTAAPPPTDKYWVEVTRDNDKRLRAYESTPPVTAIAKKEYKPKKNPLYVGISVKGDEKPRVQNLLRHSLAKIQQSTNPEASIIEDATEFNQDALTAWKWPEGAFHVTTCYVGGDKTAAASDAFKYFEEGIHFPFRTKHIVYVPGKIVLAIVYLDSALIHSGNKFPHMTLAVKNVPAKLSNDVLEALFGGVFYQRYKEGLRFGSDKVSTLNIQLNGEPVTAYLLELPQEVYFDGETKAFSA